MYKMSITPKASNNSQIQPVIEKSYYGQLVFIHVRSETRHVRHALLCCFGRGEMVEGNWSDSKGKLKREQDTKRRHGKKTVWVSYSQHRIRMNVSFCQADSEDALKSLKLQILHIEGPMLKRVNIKIPDFLVQWIKVSQSVKVQPIVGRYNLA